ncbi:TatD family nuclease-associated radical SAM protein [Christensenella timonensis]|uniref:TatD family nuclease-associated radical SAM protein n=1 Tax=Christensenella timonensis TaxID=1816678 RepID=UPI00082BA087|nr:TatD family nuclease-associated radical SAM protein [Christensenella timonensis]
MEANLDTYVYKLGDVNYINLTNRCTNDCEFCLRRTGDGVAGYDLWLKQEPTAGDIIKQLEKDKTDVVFCGYGEPTIRIDELKEVAAYVKNYGGHTRLNTNGHASAFHGRDIAQELAGLIDEVSISLNEADARKYEAVVHSRYGEDGFRYMLDFARDCVKYGIHTTLSVVDVISPEDIETCRRIAQDVGAHFRVRHYIS